MNHAQLIEAVQSRMGGSKGAAVEAVRHVTGAIKDAVHDGEKVSVSGFGIFERRTSAARRARNPATGEMIDVEARNTPKFRPAREWIRTIRQTPPAQ